MYKVGDKFEIEIAGVLSSETEPELRGDGKLYRIKGFKSLVFDDNFLDMLKKIESEVTTKTVKASELKVDTKVICWDDEGCDKGYRHFAKFENGRMYTFNNGSTSWSSKNRYMTSWDYMTLEDGTVVLPE